jgi:four helix bundle protein
VAGDSDIEASRAKPKVASYRDLLVWQKGMDLVVRTYEVSMRLPPSEIYGLASQIQRAAVSVPANIAEGHGRHHLGDYLHHLSVANGSLKELETHLLIAKRLAFLKGQDVESVIALSEEVGRMLRGLARGL